MHWHHYQAFGLRIRSCFPLPELLAATGPEFDVEISYDSVSPELPGAVDVGLRYQTAPRRLLIVVEGIARFLVLEGARILIDRCKDAEDNAVRLFLLASVFGGLLLQREELVLRGSAIEVNGQAMVFLGVPGIGKSTLAIAFKKKGYRFLTDEFCVVRTGPEARRMIQAGFPQAKLWPDSLKKLDLLPETLSCVRRGIQKRALPIKEDFTSEPLPIGKVYVLSSRTTNSVSLTTLEGSAAYTVFVGDDNLSPFLKGFGLESHYRQFAMTLALGTPAIVVNRPKNKFNLTEIVDILEADFLK
jgi:hypothetical protein